MTSRPKNPSKNRQQKKTSEYEAQAKGVAQLKQRNATNFKYNHGLLIALLLSFLYLHGVGLFLFTKGFLLTRLVLEHKSSCQISPLQAYGDALASHPGGGCWHPKTFDKAVVVIIDALRYDFTIPFVPDDNSSLPLHCHNAFTTPYEIASKHPENLSNHGLCLHF